jgi:hypothetical protein
MPFDPMFEPGGRLRCEDCDAHRTSPEGHATSELLFLVYALAGYGPTPEHPYGRPNDVPDELHLRGPYYAPYHERGHLSYAELDLEETPTDP